jgi:hypothetical protein
MALAVAVALLAAISLGLAGCRSARGGLACCGELQHDA